MKREFKEEDMFPVVEAYFSSLGYRVSAEVNDCDIVLTKEDSMIILEMKKALSLDLLVQAVKRQKISDHTYMVIPEPKFPSRAKYYDIIHLIKRLSLGLIYVKDDLESMRVVVEPQKIDMAKVRSSNRKKRERLKKEVRGRTTQLNRGGQSGRKIMTAYREDCLRLVYAMDRLGHISPKKGKELGIYKAQAILRDNHYGWYVNVERGKYCLTDEGRKALVDYAGIMDTVTRDIILESVTETENTESLTPVKKAENPEKKSSSKTSSKTTSKTDGKSSKRKTEIEIRTTEIITEEEIPENIIEEKSPPRKERTVKKTVTGRTRKKPATVKEKTETLTLISLDDD